VAKTTDNTVKFLLAARRSISIGITNAAGAVASEMKRGMKQGLRLRSSAAGTPPNRQRSDLANSIGNTTATEKDGKFTASAGSALPYAGIHERGGTIRPKTGRFIPVPLNLEAKRLRETHKGSLSSLPMFVMRTPRGKLLLVGKSKVRYRNKESGIKLNGEPVFALVRSVRMPRRPWASAGLEVATKSGKVDRALRQAVKRGLTNFTAGVAK
jgi:phage gpG-like protein